MLWTKQKKETASKQHLAPSFTARLGVWLYCKEQKTLVHWCLKFYVAHHYFYLSCCFCCHNLVHVNSLPKVSYLLICLESRQSYWRLSFSWAAKIPKNVLEPYSHRMCRQIEQSQSLIRHDLHPAYNPKLLNNILQSELKRGYFLVQSN